MNTPAESTKNKGSPWAFLYTQRQTSVFQSTDAPTLIARVAGALRTVLVILVNKFQQPLSTTPQSPHCNCEGLSLSGLSDALSDQARHLVELYPQPSDFC